MTHHTPDTPDTPDAPDALDAPNALDARTEAVRELYRATLPTVPAGVQERLRLARKFGRLPTEEAIAQLRHIVLTDSPLGARTQQLVHFGQLLALGREHPARIHARGALHAGATLTDLIAVAETALITAGVPAYALGTEIITEHLPHDNDPPTEDGA
ncbi:carboxymuconolactone decarboxylase family protein [Kitasatospora sp. NPDC005856]|uniref:carboxymuconolactone decarboxylase family protein n=1 Tax=Kitasatospora sp. NPDC005856 TaxID=3154566 RepID=UPI0033E386F0